MVTQEKLAIIQKLRPIDDTLFEVLAADKAVCQEILRTILGDDRLVVVEVYPQDSVKNLLGRSVRLDARCTLSSGKTVNIEVQKADDDDHVKRVRFNASCLTVDRMEKRSVFADVPEVMIVYISSFDPFRHGTYGNRTVYHLRTAIVETGNFIDDGVEAVMVNCAVNDGTDIAELMTCFQQTEVNHPKFPDLSDRMSYIKESEGGQREMCEVVEKYAEKYAEKSVEKARNKMVSSLVEKGVDEKIIAEAANLTVEQVKEILSNARMSGKHE